VGKEELVDTLIPFRSLGIAGTEIKAVESELIH
jgi:hypothetical protein